MCRRFYEACDRIYKKHRMSQRPERVFSVSELRVTSVLDATLLMCGSADGYIVPPFVIFPGRQMKLSSARESYPDAFFTTSIDGRVTDVIFLWWFRDHFLKHLPAHIQRPIVLLVDRTVCEVTFQLIQIAREEKVNIISVPPPVSHLLHPIDDDIGKNIENQVTKRARKWEDENPGVHFTQKVLSHILRKVWTKGLNPRDIINKFADTGVFPLNHVVMTLERITMATQVMKAERPPPPAYGKELSMFSGLNLLSALSSHEYASLDSMVAGEGTSKSPVEPAPKVPRSSQRNKEERVVVKVNRRLVQEVEEEEVVDDKLDITDMMDHQPKLMVSMISHDTSKEEITVGDKTDAEEEDEPSIHRELAAARDNKDQIDRAVESIGGLIAIVGDAAVKDEDGAVLQQVTEQEVVEEIVQEEVIHQEFYQPPIEGPSHRRRYQPHQSMPLLDADGEQVHGNVELLDAEAADAAQAQGGIRILNPESGEVHYIPEGIDASQLQYVSGLQYLQQEGHTTQEEHVEEQTVQEEHHEEGGPLLDEFRQQQNAQGQGHGEVIQNAAVLEGQPIVDGQIIDGQLVERQARAGGHGDKDTEGQGQEDSSQGHTPQEGSEDMEIRDETAHQETEETSDLPQSAEVSQQIVEGHEVTEDPNVSEGQEVTVTQPGVDGQVVMLENAVVQNQEILQNQEIIHGQEIMETQEVIQGQEIIEGQSSFEGQFINSQEIVDSQFLGSESVVHQELLPVGQQYVTQDGQPLVMQEGQFLTTDGQLITADGQYVTTTDGQLLTTDGQLMTTDGQLLSTDGQIMTSQGHVMTSGGATIFQEPQYQQVIAGGSDYHQIIDNSQILTDENGQQFVLQNTVTETIAQPEPEVINSHGLSDETLAQIMQQLGARNQSKGPISIKQVDTKVPAIKQIRIVRPKPKPKPQPQPQTPSPSTKPRQRVIRIVQPKGRKLTAAQLQQIAQQVLPAGVSGKIVVQEQKKSTSSWGLWWTDIVVMYSFPIGDVSRWPFVELLSWHPPILVKLL